LSRLERGRQRDHL